MYSCNSYLKTATWFHSCSVLIFSLQGLLPRLHKQGLQLHVHTVSRSVRHCKRTCQAEWSLEAECVVPVQVVLYGRVASGDSSEPPQERLGKLSFVDLAGSERAARTGNVGARLK